MPAKQQGVEAGEGELCEPELELNAPAPVLFNSESSGPGVGGADKPLDQNNKYFYISDFNVFEF